MIRNKKIFILLIVVVLLNLPSFIYDNLIIYNTTTDFAGGDFANMVFNYSLVNLILLIWGATCYRSIKNMPNFFIILFFVGIKDVLLLLCGNKFAFSSWEMYLSLATGMSCCAIISSLSKSDDFFEKFIDYLIVANFIYQILFIITGRVGESGRVSVIGQGPGAVGYMCAMNIINILLYRLGKPGSVIMLVVCLISIVLSGSRFSLLVTMVGFIFLFRQIFGSLQRKYKIVILSLCILLLGGISYVLLNKELQSSYAIVDRMSGVYDISEMSEDQSMLERITSFVVGFDVLSQNPFGLSNTYADLQFNMIENGFFAFPHSTLLCYYILWGPILLYCVYWLIKNVFLASKKKLIKEKRHLIFLLVIYLVYGGLVISTKDVVFEITYLTIIIRRIRLQISYELTKTSYLQ